MINGENVERTYDLSNFIEMMPETFFPALINQGKVNFSIHTGAAELKDNLFEFIQNNLVDFHSHFEGEKDDVRTLSKNFEITNNTLNLLLHAMSLYCQCKVIFENNQFNVILHAKN